MSVIVWNIIPNDQRLRLWKNLRNNIEQLTLEEKLKEIAAFCFDMPIGARSLDYYNTSNWPTPWEILFHGLFCLSSISLLMYYTIELLSDNINIELLLVDDNDNLYLLPLINNQYVLNYELGVVSNFPEVKNVLKILKRYSSEQIKKIR